MSLNQQNFREERSFQAPSLISEAERLGSLFKEAQKARQQKIKGEGALNELINARIESFRSLDIAPEDFFRMASWRFFQKDGLIDRSQLNRATDLVLLDLHTGKSFRESAFEKLQGLGPIIKAIEADLRHSFVSCLDYSSPGPGSVLFNALSASTSEHRSKAMETVNALAEIGFLAENIFQKTILRREPTYPPGNAILTEAFVYAYPHAHREGLIEYLRQTLAKPEYRDLERSIIADDRLPPPLREILVRTAREVLSAATDRFETTQKCLKEIHPLDIRAGRYGDREEDRKWVGAVKDGDQWIDGEIIEPQLENGYRKIVEGNGLLAASLDWLDAANPDRQEGSLMGALSKNAVERAAYFEALRFAMLQTAHCGDVARFLAWMCDSAPNNFDIPTPRQKKDLYFSMTTLFEDPMVHVFHKERLAAGMAAAHLENATSLFAQILREPLFSESGRFDLTIERDRELIQACLAGISTIRIFNDGSESDYTYTQKREALTTLRPLALTYLFSPISLLREAKATIFKESDISSARTVEAQVDWSYLLTPLGFQALRAVVGTITRNEVDIALLNRLTGESMERLAALSPSTLLTHFGAPKARMPSFNDIDAGWYLYSAMADIGDPGSKKLFESAHSSLKKKLAEVVPPSGRGGFFSFLADSASKEKAELAIDAARYCEASLELYYARWQSRITAEEWSYNSTKTTPSRWQRWFRWPW